jgi:hypothetical protein
MRFRSLVGLVAGCALLAACEGLKEALTAHVDVAARAGNQELSVTRLGDLLGNAKINVPVNRETAGILADIWTGYQQMAYAAAHGDSLNDKKAIDQALAPMFNAQKVTMLMDSISKSFKVDSGSEAAYNQAAGGLLAARHILIGYKNPTVPPTQAEKDSVRKKAESVLPQVNPANFADMAKKYSTDPTAAQNKGYLGVFPKGPMVQAFYDATAALKPGEISKLVETQFGFHIIQRLPYAEAQKDFSQQYAGISTLSADSAFRAQTEAAAKIQVKDNAAAAIKEAAKEPTKHRTDKSTLATFNGGDLTVADFLSWMESVPPQQGILQRIPGAPDSSLKTFIKQVALQQVLLRRADSAHVTLKEADKANMYSSISGLVGNLEMTLGIDAKTLADSAKSVPEKERLAAAHVDAYLDRMMAGQAQGITVPPPLKKILDAKYESSVNSAGVDRGFERAQKLRRVADSTRTANQPKSQIPLPGGVGAPPGTQPQPPQPTPQPAKPETPATKKP